MSEFIKITEDNIEKEHLCCIIREKKTASRRGKETGMAFKSIKRRACLSETQ